MSEDIKPWYRQFWPWFLIALPASAVAAGIATLVIAIEHPDGLVVDDYYKQGLAINRVLARDQRAQRLGLSALVRYNPETETLAVQLQSAQPLGRPALTITLAHPTRAHLDRVLTLGADARGAYRAALTDLPPGLWHMTIEPPDRDWRLTGRVQLPERAQTRLVAGTDW
ncbi:MAG TPA: FixH family protein [Gammaproteobacteria bacterium]|nr:FixH family protein [Gammaproteobacteria bacterium]